MSWLKQCKAMLLKPIVHKSDRNQWSQWKAALVKSSWRIPMHGSNETKLVQAINNANHFLQHYESLFFAVASWISSLKQCKAMLLKPFVHVFEQNQRVRAPVKVLSIQTTIDSIVKPCQCACAQSSSPWSQWKAALVKQSERIPMHGSNETKLVQAINNANYFLQHYDALFFAVASWIS